MAVPQINLPPNGQLVLLGVAGSQAYGLATPESDTDYQGCWRASTRQMLSLTKPKPSIVQKAPDPDLTVHEVEKFITLCLKGNPTVLETLFLDEYAYVSEQYGRPLLDNRTAFLSQELRPRYKGYAIAQKERLKRSDPDDKDLRLSIPEKRAKFKRHAYRLILQGSRALRGEMAVRLTDVERVICFEFGKLSDDDFSEAMDEIVEEYDAIESTLPEHPDRELANEILLNIRGW